MKPSVGILMGSDSDAGVMGEAARVLKEFGVSHEMVIASAHRLLGEIALVTNPHQLASPLAAPHFEPSVAMLRAINAENELALAYAGYGRLHQQQGNTAQARDYLTRALEIFDRLGTLLEPDKVRQALAGLPVA